MNANPCSSTLLPMDNTDGVDIMRYGLAGNIDLSKANFKGIHLEVPNTPLAVLKLILGAMAYMFAWNRVLAIVTMSCGQPESKIQALSISNIFGAVLATAQGSVKMTLALAQGAASETTLAGVAR